MKALCDTDSANCPADDVTCLADGAVFSTDMDVTGLNGNSRVLSYEQHSVYGIDIPYTEILLMTKKNLRSAFRKRKKKRMAKGEKNEKTSSMFIFGVVYDTWRMR